jgi:outer membrane biosynthesis protein TonB
MTATETTKPLVSVPAKVATQPAAPVPTKKVIRKAVAPKTPGKTPTKVAEKPTPKVAAKPVAKPTVKPAAKTVAKPAKVKKPKIVRDSFTMPKAEFAVIDALKVRATQLKTAAKKTELLRAGIKALAAMSDSAFLAAIAAVPSLKTGRPAKS